MSIVDNIKIEKGIPIPASPKHHKEKSKKKRKYKSKWRDVLGSMEIGDSFLFPVEVKDSTAFSTIHNNSRYFRMKKFSVFYISTTSGTRLRCWRVS